MTNGTTSMNELFLDPFHYIINFPFREPTLPQLHRRLVQQPVRHFFQSDAIFVFRVSTAAFILQRVDNVSDPASQSRNSFCRVRFHGGQPRDARSHGWLYRALDRSLRGDVCQRRWRRAVRTIFSEPLYFRNHLFVPRPLAGAQGSVKQGFYASAPACFRFPLPSNAHEISWVECRNDFYRAFQLQQYVRVPRRIWSEYHLSIWTIRAGCQSTGDEG
mmetsp:Transcript_3463/g.7226  ORF Transcript_3463/g.7226 Transcript_3463/m.7226 type:complete len:217 (+) Transcript_3463:142-792(+)